MNIISWNVNGLRAVEKKGFIPWLLSSGADVVCIQETKADISQLSPELIAPGDDPASQGSAEADPGLNPSDENFLAAGKDGKGGRDDKNAKNGIESKDGGEAFSGEKSGNGKKSGIGGIRSGIFSGSAGTEPRTKISYYSYFSSAKKAGYSGTAVYSLKKPDKVTTLGIPEFDDEGRVTAAFFGRTVIISAYFPNSQAEGARLPYKLRFCDAILDFCSDLVSSKNNVVLCGDYNIAHKPIDLENPKANEKNPGYLPEERAWMDKFTSSGYVDTFRRFCAEPKQYTWWSYRFRAREKDIGWRIDYQCVNEKFLSSVKSSSILKNVMGSDHCPINIEISETL
ncbi:exodeoxyribonuclease III [Treponema parvum]|uniref:exodeoxyribonuclease III n=1 Tax=Treponema parvum TaxID=138851 RepID=UPI001AEC178F|nr:exodeoxyribonuclease III [Treponema parvum]QTQ16739.1 exodeoxyribonuclease III [Treponema parvum]